MKFRIGGIQPPPPPPTEMVAELRLAPTQSGEFRGNWLRLYLNNVHVLSLSKCGKIQSWIHKDVDGLLPFNSIHMGLR